jgi:hypothetical protein
MQPAQPTPGLLPKERSSRGPHLLQSALDSLPGKNRGIFHPSATLPTFSLEILVGDCFDLVVRSTVLSLGSINSRQSLMDINDSQ